MIKIPVVAMNKDAEGFRNELFISMRLAEKRRDRQISRGKVKNLGVIEYFRLFLSGRADGKLGMPRETPEHVWTSPFLQKEMNAVNEKSDDVWGKQEIILEPYFLRIESLLTVIAGSERRIVELNNRLRLVNEETVNLRKRGEDRLSDEQVRTRRLRECEHYNTTILAEISEVENSLEAYYEELSILHCFITESENAAKIVCERLMDHTRQRLQIYWRAALKTHPDGLSIPAVPLLPEDTGSSAEALYLARHKNLSENICSKLEVYRNRNEAQEEVANNEEAI